MFLTSRKTRILALSVFFLLAVILRTQILSHQSVITTDGVGYATLGKNLIQGHGYVGYEGIPVESSLVRSPLYPVFVGLGWKVIGDAALAGRSISVLFGSLLLFPAYWLGKAIYSREVGIFSALLVAFHPLLIEYSGVVLNYAMYSFFLVTAITAGYLALRRRTVGMYAATGGLLGFSYLVRPEAIGYLAVVGVSSVVYRGLDDEQVVTPKWVVNLIAFLSVFLLVSSPYLLFLYQKTGAISTGGSSSLNLIIGERVTNPEPLVYEHIVYGLTENGTAFAIERYRHIGTFEYIASRPIGMLKRYMFNTYDLYVNVIARSLSLVFFGLVFLGLFGREWSRERSMDELFLLFVVLYPVVAFPLFFIRPRFLYSTIPITALWAAKGLLLLQEWSHTSFGSLVPSPRVLEMSVVLLVCLLLVSPAIPPMTNALAAKEPIEHKEAGHWLEDHSQANDVVMSRKPWVAFYAERTNVLLPFAKYSTVAKFACQRSVDYLVVDERYIESKRPQLRFLLDSTRAKRRGLRTVYHGTGRSEILIYRLRCANAGAGS